ncbi:MAG: 4Fe-4S dicluster domain-containing protein [Planctomycetes bacterium]|nr:4Fe-4S dicluster domain-containing protein [Planctomycetota bacterium]
MQYGFVLDHRKCIGCHACTVACKSENDVPVGDFRTWVKYTEIGEFPAVKRHFAVLRCNHCTNAPCVTICPVNALEKRDDGIVDLDRDACIGCKACMQACPYDAIYLNEDKGAAEKCHYCAHRVEQNLEPACVVVCPERAIIPGDLHDPNSEIAKLAALDGSVVRRPEQGTGPNVHYLGVDPVSLHPGMAAEPDTYIWSERRLPAPDYPSQAAFDTAPNARTVLDVNHDVRWGTKVSAYLVTKGIAAGAALIAPFVSTIGFTGTAGAWAPEVVALLFTAITTALLVLDLKRPQYFFRLLTRPNLKSWLVRGGFVLMGFSGLTTVILIARAAGQTEFADALRWPNALLGWATAVYTAFLFAQCEGRDLWQQPRRLVVHLTAQALMCGGFALLPFACSAGGAPTMMLLALVGTVVHVLLAFGELHTEHETENAKQAASLLPRIKVTADGELRAFPIGLAGSVLAALVGFALTASGAAAAPFLAVVLALVSFGALFLYEQAFVRAAQIPPLS